MNKKEKNNKKNKRKEYNPTKVSLVILVISVIAGSLLISAGFLLTKNSIDQAENITKEDYETAKAVAQERIDKANERIAELKQEIENLKEEIKKIETEESQATTEQTNENKKEELQSELTEHQQEQQRLENDDYTVTSLDIKEPEDYTYLCHDGGIVIATGIITSLILIMIVKPNKKRKK